MAERKSAGNPTVSREDLLRAARQTIERAREEVDVPTALVRRVMRAARTARRITGGWRSRDNSCGCLIGEVRGPDLDSWMDDLSDAEREIGEQFPLFFMEAVKELDPYDVFEVTE